MVLMLKHSRKLDEDASSTILIGFYSSRKRVLDVIKKYRRVTGFCDYPDAFEVEEWEVDVDDYNEVSCDYKESIFYLSHEYYDGAMYDYLTDIGVYSSLEKAKNALRTYQKLPIFKEHSEGFVIDEYEINKDHWTEGFDIYG